MYTQITKCKLGMSYLYHGIFGTVPGLGYTEVMLVFNSL
jgi:hypothetical protein